METETNFWVSDDLIDDLDGSQLKWSGSKNEKNAVGDKNMENVIFRKKNLKSGS
jgi:hypothetical protein